MWFLVEHRTNNTKPNNFTVKFEENEKYCGHFSVLNNNNLLMEMSMLFVIHTLNIVVLLLLKRIDVDTFVFPANHQFLEKKMKFHAKI